ncbi:MAG: NAD(P)-dependent oxidoreductase [Clostridiales bacterium]|nr:NAD(P)-dependent oxidoreductase [Clostridiales bacterium]
MKKAIVTGATGAVGTALVKKLINEGVEVLVLVRKEGRVEKIPKSPLVKTVFCSLGEMADFQNTDNEKYDAFFHLAWAGPYGKDRNDMMLQSDNIKHELDAVNLAHRFGCEVFVGAGSQAENGRLPSGEKVSPASPEKPDNGYGIAKLTAGRMSRILCEQLGIRHCWCRILSAYGPGDGSHTMVMSTIIKFLNGEDCDFTKGEQQWDFLYNGDIANAFYLVAEKGKNGAVYAVGSGKTKSLKEYITTIRDIAAPGAKCNFGAIDYFPNQVMCLCADITDLKNDTGFEPTTTFPQGIKNTVEWYKAYGKGAENG